MKIDWIQRIILLLIACLFALAFLLLRYESLGSFIHRNDHACIDTLPSVLKIVSNGDEFAVKTKYFNEYKYLWNSNNNGLYISTSWSPYTTFSDSCVCKSFAWQYLRQEREYRERKKSFK